MQQFHHIYVPTDPSELLKMDRKAFINAYENASKQSKEEKLQYRVV